MWQTRLIRKPSQPGTKRLVEQLGAQLVCVNYCHDERLHKHVKTIELIIEEICTPTPIRVARDGRRRSQPQETIALFC